MVLVVKNLPANAGDARDASRIPGWERSSGWGDSQEKGMATDSSIFSGKFHGQRSLAGYSP